jgi:predicted O-methyltransferase YrrM
LLELLAQAVGARAILELGTLGGYSTTWLARGLFDLIFVDADKQSNPEYLGEALRLSRPGTLIVADNVVRDDAVMDPGSEDPSVQGARRFLELVA